MSEEGCSVKPAPGLVAPKEESFGKSPAPPGAGDLFTKQFVSCGALINPRERLFSVSGFRVSGSVLFLNPSPEPLAFQQSPIDYSFRRMKRKALHPIAL